MRLGEEDDASLKGRDIGGGCTMRTTDSVTSEAMFLNATVGIPRGSPLSSFLFNVYSLQSFKYDAVHNTNIIMSYIDDFALVAVNKSWTNNSTVLSRAGNKLQSHVNNGGMHFDISKTKLLHCSCKNILSNKDTVKAHVRDLHDNGSNL